MVGFCDARIIRERRCSRKSFLGRGCCENSPLPRLVLHRAGAAIGTHMNLTMNPPTHSWRSRNGNGRITTAAAWFGLQMVNSEPLDGVPEDFWANGCFTIA